jgi:hypothetical protein
MSRQHGRPVGQQTGISTTHTLPTPAGGVRLETFVPWELVRRGVRRQVVTPSGEPLELGTPASKQNDIKAETHDTPLLRALGLAHHWRRLLYEERIASMDQIAQAEGVDVNYVRRPVRLTLLAPKVVERLAAGDEARLDDLLGRSLPIDWSEHERCACLASGR